MNIREIIPGILYAGVNDRVTDRFEALWPLPNGVSYNSYIVRGTEKNALIDTVEISTLTDYVRGIHDLIGDARIDYVVINHMEPDHSGSIPYILEEYMDAKIVGNKQTLGMVRGFYHIPDDRLMEIAEGTEIDLGGKTLRFHMTPMVHWPETMMTYVVEDRVLFSGDAFGTFGALNGGVIDSEMETGWYRDEMYRYYSNIVGKYGRFVEKAIAKLQGLEIDYICSTHGPVWHERISEVVDIYSRLAQYKSEPGVTIIYGTMYGNTAEVAEEIGRQLSARGVRNIKIHNASHDNLSDMINDAFRYEGIIVGSPTYSMHIFPPVEQFMIAMETREIKNKVLATFGSFTWASAAGAKLNEYAEKMKLTPVYSLVMKQSIDASVKEEICKLADSVVAALKC
ncbi:MAG: FprA family A-type flavoprotein [Muribaculaceae bacterium]|jgi:Uncharacterized flavoproteins